jgi:hypothetical protein
MPVFANFANYEWNCAGIWKAMILPTRRRSFQCRTVVERDRRGERQTRFADPHRVDGFDNKDYYL